MGVTLKVSLNGSGENRLQNSNRKNWFFRNFSG